MTLLIEQRNYSIANTAYVKISDRILVLMFFLFFSGEQMNDKDPKRPSVKVNNPPGGKSSGSFWQSQNYIDINVSQRSKSVKLIYKLKINENSK